MHVFLTSTSSIVRIQLVSKVATTHKASIGDVTILIASTYTKSTCIHLCLRGESYAFHINSVINEWDRGSEKGPSAYFSRKENQI